VVDPGSSREQDFESLTLTRADIKRVETKNGQLLLKLAKEEVTLSPIFMAAVTPTEGPQGRRSGNNYTRLFVRYPGFEDSKLANEGLTTGEKLKLAYDIANAGMNIATNLNPIGAVSALQSFIKITREIHGTVKSQTTAPADAASPLSSIAVSSCLSHFISFRSSTKIEYITGTSRRVMNVAAVSPPICA
jgi:hypothetical protein